MTPIAASMGDQIRGPFAASACVCFGVSPALHSQEEIVRDVYLGHMGREEEAGRCVGCEREKEEGEDSPRPLAPVPHFAAGTYAG